MSDSRSKQGIYLILLVGLIGTAGYFFWRNVTAKPIDAMPNTADTAQVFVCGACGHTQKYTPRQQADLMAKASAQTEFVDMTSARKLFLKCPACNEMAMVPGADCPQCHAPYVQATPDRKWHMLCPACEKARGAQGMKNPGGGA